MDKIIEFSRQLDGSKHAVITVGASQGLYLVMQSFVEEGDEVVIIEPAFDLYMSNVEMAKAVPKFVPLRSKSDDPANSSELHMDIDELSAAMSDRTR